MLVRLVVPVSGDLRGPHSADGRMRKWSFTQMCYNKRIPGKRVYMETQLESDYFLQKRFLFCFVLPPLPNSFMHLLLNSTFLSLLK